MAIDHLVQYQIKPGEVRNPWGNAEGHSTRTIKSRVQRYLDNPTGDIAHNPDFQSKAAVDALIETLLDKALNDKDTNSIRMLFEHAEGKPNQQVTVNNTMTVTDTSLDRLNEAIAAIKNKQLEGSVERVNASDA